MKNNLKNRATLTSFIFIYAFLTAISSPVILENSTQYINTYNLIIFFLITFVSMALTTIVNKNNIDKLVKIYTIETNIILAIYVIDYFMRIFTENESYFRMLWFSNAFIAGAGIYFGLLLSKSSAITKHKFWLSFAPTYFFIFVVVFFRKPNTYYELNLILGHGILSYTDYLISSFNGDYWMVFNFVGNVVYFIPLFYVMKSLFEKAKIYKVIIICAVIPFLVEGYQFVFKCGSVDIDDIVLNLSGIFIGLVIFLIEKISNTAD